MQSSALRQHQQPVFDRASENRLPISRNGSYSNTVLEQKGIHQRVLQLEMNRSTEDVLVRV